VKHESLVAGIRAKPLLFRSERPSHARVVIYRDHRRAFCIRRCHRFLDPKTYELMWARSAASAVSGCPGQIQRMGITPFPVADLRHVLTVAVDVVFVLDQLVLQLSLQV
jgi:hypothetical protein